MTVVALGAAVVGVLVLAALALGLGGTTVSTTIEGGAGPATPIPADSAAGAFVVQTNESGPAFSIFGLNFGSHRYDVHVGVVPPTGCAADPGNRIEASGACAGIAVEGEVSGSGTLQSGEAFLIVTTRVSQECFDALAPGNSWPPAGGACSP